MSNATIDTPKEPIRVEGGFQCPKCRTLMEAVPGTMAFRGKFFAGLVCHPCNALWDNPDDSMIEHAKANYNYASLIDGEDRA